MQKLIDGNFSVPPALGGEILIAGNLDHVISEVDVFPLQCQHFRLPQAGIQGYRDKGVNPA